MSLADGHAPDIDSVWKNIERHAGETFQQIRGGAFTYKVGGAGIKLDRTNQAISKSEFAKALKFLPLPNTRPLQNLRGPSYIYAILTDPRIITSDTQEPQPSPADREARSRVIETPRPYANDASPPEHISVESHASELPVFDALRLLSRDRSVFYSEKDFQHALAWKLRELNPDSQIRLECPFAAPSGRIHLDLIVRNLQGMFAFEVKYKSRSIDVQVQGERFALADQAAQHPGRYDYFKDIQRLEHVCAETPKCTGYAIFLTNDSAYWKASTRGMSRRLLIL